MFEIVSKELQLKFDKILTFTTHAATIGVYREAAIRDTLTNCLGERFNVVTGFIHNHPAGTSSKQMDILIVDENYPAAYFLKADDFVVVNVEAVVCAIEIKSNFNKKEFTDIIKKCSSVKSMNKKIDFFSFCFKSSMSNEKILDLYTKLEFTNTRENFPNLISIFNRGCLFLKPDDEELGHWLLVPALMRDDVQKQSLSLFVASIVNSCFDRCGIEKKAYSTYQTSLVSRFHSKKLRFAE